MKSITVVLVDTMMFAYLQGLGRLSLLRELAVATGKIAVTRAVLRQLHRSGRLGAEVQSYCDRGEVECISIKAGDDVAKLTGRILASNDGSLVRRNRVDAELVACAHLNDGAVMTCERGIHALADRRNVPSLDLVHFFAWARRLELATFEDTEAVFAAWKSSSGPGLGAPSDLAESFDETLDARPGLVAILDALDENRSAGVEDDDPKGGSGNT